MDTLLSINNYYYVRGGAESVFLDHNEIFGKAGWRVVPFAMQHPKNEDSEWSPYFAEEIELGNDYGLFGTATRSLKAIYSREAASRVAALADKVQPTIAHAHNVYHHLSPSIFAPLRKRDIPVVLTLHDLKIACPAYRMFTHDGICERCKGGNLWNAAVHRCMHNSRALSLWVTAEAYLHRLLGSYTRNVSHLIVPSRFYRDKFVEWGWSPDRFSYVPNFVDAGSIRPEPQPGRRFTYFGRLSHEKGIATFIRAVAAAGVQGRVAGTGPEGEQLARLATELGADIEFTGFLRGEELYDAIRDSRAIVIPSEWYENAPISVLEAFAAAKPVIGADIGGIPELIDPSRGSVFESFSESSLADVLGRYARESNDQLAAMGRAARDYVIEHHSREAYRQRCEDVYALCSAHAGEVLREY